MRILWKPTIAAVALALAGTGCTTIIRSSTGPNGQAANAVAQSLGSQTISDNGRFTAFTSAASNLVPGDTNGVFDVFRHDNVTGTNTRVSLKDDGSQIVGSIAGLAMSGDGDAVAFWTDQALESGDTNGTTDIYVRTISAGTTERVSIKPDGSPIFVGGNVPQALGRTSISDDGRYVLVTDSMPGQGHAYFRDRTAHTTVVLATVAASAFIAGNGTGIVQNQLCTGGPCSFTSSFLPANGSAGEYISEGCGFEAYDVSADARYVVGRRFGVYPTFECPAPTGTVRWDRTTKQLQPVGLDTTNTGGVTISNNGRFVALLGDDGILRVADLQTGATQVADRDFQGRRGSTATSHGAISGNGRYVVIGTAANLTADDVGVSDVFTRYAIEPSATSATPSSLARGSSHVTVRINGTEFLPAPTVTFPAGGVTVHSVAVVNPNRLDVELSVAPDAPTGPTDVLVTNTGAIGGAHSLCACLTIN